MMTFEKFKEYINTICSFNEYLDSIDTFGISLYETPIPELFYKMQSEYEQLVFTDEALDWINWWLYEKNSKWDYQIKKFEAYDKDGNVIPSDTIEDLWNIIKEYIK